MKYRQVTPTQRYPISALRVAGKSQRQIAAKLGFHSSTISRELRRNSVRGYDPEKVQYRANTRRRVAFKRYKRLPWLTTWAAEREQRNPVFSLPNFCDPLLRVTVVFPMKS